MKESIYKSIPKRELARSQLNVALRLYLNHEEYPSVITLAGAAEEILGQLATENGHESALKKKLGELLALHKEVWGEEAKESDYAVLRNNARNEMKHFRSGKEVTLDYEHEAAQMLSRTLQNYMLCFGQPHPDQYKFTKLEIASWRKKQQNNV